MADSSDPAKLKAAATYNAAADHFDDGPLAFWDRYGRRTVERLGLRPGASVLDVGCGSGASAIPAARLVGPSGHVVGADLAERLLAIAQSKARAQSLANVEFREADMERLGYPDHAFDAVVCVFAVFFVPDMVKLVRELWRMVKPGGKLAITTWGPRMFEPGSAAWWAAVNRHRPDLVNAFNPWERVITVPAVTALLKDSGIEGAEVTAEDGRQGLKSPDDWWTVVLGSGYRWTVEQMDAATAERVKADSLAPLRDGRVDSIETNVIYAVATKS